ncbi:MAG: cyclic nucleotide-binding domain-containing protein [Candidatus Latescibacteria bacterium]|nr:cyclic nucleotide-binding domain-containing protein [Candidatus Latescibacterota bacterium]
MPSEGSTPATTRTYKDGELIVEQGSVCEFMYIVRRGQVEILHNDQGALIQKAVLGKGSFFGEVPFLERIISPSIARTTARALGEVQVISVSQDTILHRIHDNPELGYRLLQTLSRRIRELEEEMIRYIVSG